MATSVPLQNPLLAAPERPLPRSVAIIGAGTIGPDIGYYLKSALPDLELFLVDVVPEALERAVARITANVEKGRAKGKLSEDRAARVLEKLTPTLDYAAIAGCDWVLEAATEEIDLKHRIFAEVEKVVRPDALITSNTSSLPAERLFSGLRHPERATVTHFFAPAFRNPVVEVIRWAGADPEVIEYLRWLFCKTGKVPLVTADAVCFMLDRVFDNWCNEAAHLLDAATAAAVDAVARDYVHAGPFQVLNLANGNPIIVKTNTLQADEEGEHYRPARIFSSVESWRLGKPRALAAESDAAVRDRLLGILFSQSVDILDRGIGTRAELDLGCCLALGFKQGPLELMGRLGDDEVRRILDRLSAERPGMPRPKSELTSYQDFRRHLLVDDVGGVKVITLRRPHALNALDDLVTDEILALLREHEGDPAVSGFVITGYGERAFSAGADIGRFPELLGRPEEAAQYARDCSRLLVHLDTMSKPVVAALNGMALGGGLELAMRCHGMVATRDAWLQFPEITLGIAPGIGGMVVPYRKWPESAEVFHDMLRKARRLPAIEARGIGVIDHLADDYVDLIRLAVERVHALAGAVVRIPDGPVEIPAPAKTEPVDSTGRPLSAEVIGIIERTVRAAARANTLADALELGYVAFGGNACTAAAKEGIAAFTERRKPDFTRTA